MPKNQETVAPAKESELEEHLDKIGLLSLEEVKVEKPVAATKGKKEKEKEKKKDDEAKAPTKGKKGSKTGKAGKGANAKGVKGDSGSAINMVPQNADPNIIRSGHSELNTLFASNDVVTEPITVNVCNAPNNSTVQCGCDNINCPFCNIMISIEKTDPTVLQ